MVVRLKAEGLSDFGGTSLIMHNERLQDPLDCCTRALKKITSKTKKVDADHERAAWVEFAGGLYTAPELELNNDLLVVGNSHKVIVPAANILRCLQDGATRSKKGRDVLRGVMPLAEFARLTAFGLNGQTPAELYAETSFTLRKGVVVQRQRITRTRPVFSEWSVTLDVEVDPDIFDLDALAKHWSDAGRYCGLGDMRPIHGRFKGTLKEVANA